MTVLSPTYTKRSDHCNKNSKKGGKLTVSAELIQNYVQGEMTYPTGEIETLQTGDGHTLLFGIDLSGVLHVIEEQSGTCHAGWHVHDLSTAAIQAQFLSDASRAVVRTFDDLSWTACPAWTMVPFANETTRAITIAGAMFAEMWEKSPFLVVDVERTHSQSASEAQIVRYHIDTAHTTGHFWVKKDVTIDLATGAYKSVPQMVCEPVINAYGDGPVIPRRLRLPGEAIPTAIATARYATDHSTDLYCVGGSTLCRFAADQQSEAMDPLALCTSEFLVGTDTLRAMTHGGITTLWGRNQSNQVYYLACRTSQLSKPAAWTPDQPCTSFRSYTTTIHVTELNSNAPVPKAMVKLSASSRTPVFINGLYYVLSATVPVQIPADPSGVLTVIEATNDSLQATVLTVTLENTTLTTNPADQTMARITALDSAEKLRGAQVPTQTVAGGVDGASTYTSLVRVPAQTMMCQSHGALMLRTATTSATKTLNLNFFGDLWDGIGAIAGI
ncbi:hypothetical protein BO82DRAFT_399143 [Aspergillus uvarum CBS 121591]|uniref:Uncharacterized protein n=1 Tax=Aspergillus uvarum CBS 121591 TaxID=1448315 RepID=A0A319D2A4_9EURO|nr:hypothetical protein BO82DRAFT_399143 [Aspergillus uvarum CBS 121591]PYH85193.1 hypothetical protein BO82DRAFT_399143 [Aspergillus uvarum CBS 121591]